MGFVAGLVVHAAAKAHVESPVSYGLGVGLLAFLMVLYLLIFFGNVLLAIIDTVFM
jgi:hypothetical protein